MKINASGYNKIILFEPFKQVTFTRISKISQKININRELFL